MARGQRSENHPSRKVSRDAFISGPPAGATLNNMVYGLASQDGLTLEMARKQYFESLYGNKA
jgi:hypothetical protein